MKKVLIITYAFPPSNNVGIHRILRFGKWLPKYGWEPVILTPQYSLNDREDEDNLQFVDKYFKKVYRTSSISGSLFAGLADKKKRNLLVRLIRGYILNKLIPEKSIVWKNEAIKEGLDIIKKENIDAIWATIGPLTSGLIGAEIKKKTGVPLVIDYRDPWTLSPYKNYTGKALEKNITIERNMLGLADAITTTSQYIKELLVDNGYFNEQRSFVLTNGYDEELQWSDNVVNGVNLDRNKYHITYTGSFYRDRQPFGFLDGLKLFIEEYPDYINRLQFNIIGNLDYSRSISEYCSNLNIKNILFEKGLVPYRVAMQYLKQSDLLLLINGKNPESRIFIPGKLFDYIVTKKPILFIGEGQPAEIVNELNIGENVTHNPVMIKESLVKLLNNKFSPSKDKIEKYSIENIAGKLSAILDSIREN